MALSKAHQAAIDSLDYHKGCLAEATQCGRKHDMAVHQAAVDRLTRHIKKYWK